MIGAIAVVIVAAGAVTAIQLGGNPLPDADSESGDASDEASAGDSRDELDTVGIERGDLTSTSEFTGALGFGESWPLSLTADGIVTGARPLGTVVDFGESLIEIDDHRVFLVEGDVPMFRDLELTSPRVAGEDVAQLQRFLIAQGFDRDGTLEADGVFDSDTRRAVMDWQEATWQQQTGRVTRSQMVFNPEPLRIAGDQRIGAVFEQLEVTAWEPTVTVDVANRDRPLLDGRHAGDDRVRRRHGGRRHGVGADLGARRTTVRRRRARRSSRTARCRARRAGHDRGRRHAGIGRDDRAGRRAAGARRGRLRGRGRGWRRAAVTWSASTSARSSTARPR